MTDPQTNILAYFQQGGVLSVRKAWMLFHTTELRRIVSRLRRKGYAILDRRQAATTHDGRRTQFKEYYLAKPGTGTTDFGTAAAGASGDPFEEIAMTSLSCRERVRVKIGGWLGLVNVGLNRWMEGLPVRVFKRKK